MASIGALAIMDTPTDKNNVRLVRRSLPPDCWTSTQSSSGVCHQPCDANSPWMHPTGTLSQYNYYSCPLSHNGRTPCGLTPPKGSVTRPSAKQYIPMASWPKRTSNKLEWHTPSSVYVQDALTLSSAGNIRCGVRSRVYPNVAEVGWFWPSRNPLPLYSGKTTFHRQRMDFDNLFLLC